MDLSRCASRGRAADLAHLVRGGGRRVGFANGCFDLFHPGHVATLEEARSVCDFLVVGLNSDRSVRARKGQTRPVMGEGERARMLSACRYVDLVVVFDEPRPDDLIRAVRPDVIVVGPNQNPLLAVRTAQEIGCEVHAIPRAVWGISTTQLIERARRPDPVCWTCDDELPEDRWARRECRMCERERCGD